MDYIYLAASFAGGAWSGYLIGQFSSIKEMNRRLNALADEKRAAEWATRLSQSQVDSLGKSITQVTTELSTYKAENDRLSDLVAKFQAKAPERAPDGKFASKRERVTAELAAYVAERKAA
jgi:hypothetical protein